ncbi:hypothetical protein ACFFUS_22190 [Vibrio gallaecicus]|uniref:Uncharacterized protein n=1 Tax=Vibrio gallaecicus TaxID=552386 RepID=A0ABV4NID9_9VIBR|nr:hypothetical protein [Vibrio gallaecicus]MDN3617417.1 hypothetical protein [Vibrio gallaecicus]
MNKKFKNTGSESGEITVQVSQAKVSFYIEPGAEFIVETHENSDIVFSSSNTNHNLVIEPV